MDAVKGLTIPGTLVGQIVGTGTIIEKPGIFKTGISTVNDPFGYHTGAPFTNMV